MPLLPTALTDQITAVDQDPLRVLVVGAGVAGLTSAQLLREAGLHPILIDRMADESRPGYMLALMPMVEAALDQLGARAPYRERSIEFTHYRARAHTGRTLRTDSMADVLDRFGEYRGIERGELIQVLSHAGAPVTLGTTVTDLHEGSDAVEITCQHGEQTTRLSVDLVVIADGIGSRTRSLVPCGQAVSVTDTGWGGWVVWAPDDDEGEVGEELWGAGLFVGVYPVLGRRGVFLGGPTAATAAGPEAFVATVRERLSTIDPRIDRALQAALDEEDPYYWPLRDVRADRWTTARTVLLGDAAAGFLPTAGVGAGMAIESAWVLAGMLAVLLPTAEPGRADRVTSAGRTAQGRVPAAVLAAVLAGYEGHQRPRVEAAQDTSRSLARLMFSTSRVLATIRDLALRFLSVERAIRPISAMLASPPHPSEAARSALWDSRSAVASQGDVARP